MNVNNIPVGAVVQWTDGASVLHTETVHNADGEKVVHSMLGWLYLEDIHSLKIISPLIVDKEKIKENLRKELDSDKFFDFFNKNSIVLSFEGGDTKIEDFLTQMVDRLLA